MKVAFLTMGKDIGGAKQDVITLSQQIADKGHTVYVLSTPGVMDKELENTKVHFIPVDFYTRNPWGLFKASRKLLKIVRKEGIELVNPQGFFTAAISWLMRFSFRPSFIPIVTTIHMFSSLKFYKHAWMLNIFSKEVITESNCERVRLEGGGTKREIITVINNSVDMRKFSRLNTKPVLRAEFSIPDDTFVFGLIARLSPEKRHNDYIDAAKRVHAQNPKTRFLIIGDGPTMEDTKQHAEGLDYITFTGMRRDIPNCLRSLDCFVLCSEVESLPLSIREAMSMELPVVVTDVGGNREIVAEGITGLLVPSKSPDFLAKAMVKVASDPQKAKEMGREGWLYCRDRFDAINWAIYTEQKFKDVLQIK